MAYATSFYSAPSASFANLTHRVESGPFAGLYTYEVRDCVVRALQSDLAKYATDSERVLFIDDLPAGYLMAKARSVTQFVESAGTSKHADYQSSVWLRLAKDSAVVS